MKRIYRCSMLVMALLVVAPCSLAAKSHFVYGVEAARDYHKKSNGKIYIVSGSFSRSTNAKHYAAFLRGKTAYPVAVKKNRRGYQTVMIGPIATAAEVRSTANQIPLTQKRAQIITQPQHQVELLPDVKRPPVVAKEPVRTWEVNHEAAPLDKRESLYAKLEKKYNVSQSNWIIGVGAGEQFPFFNDSMKVTNGSGQASPYNKDIYTTAVQNQALINVIAGRRWVRDEIWFPMITAALSYQYLFSNNVGDEIIQFSDPAFTNYTYQWEVSSNVFAALFKANIYEYRKFSPYVALGLGGAWNFAHEYSESPLANVTARVSPGYDDITNIQFAYHFHAGIEYEFKRNILISAEYQFLDIGDITSGKGSSSWSSQFLSLGPYRTNSFMVNLSYLFNT